MSLDVLSLTVHVHKKLGGHLLLSSTNEILLTDEIFYPHRYF